MSNDNETVSKHIERVIDAALTDIENTDAASEAYATTVDQIVKLHALLPQKGGWLKPELLLPVAGNLVGIVAILNFERAHVVTSKALSFVLKPRW